MKIRSTPVVLFGCTVAFVAGILLGTAPNSAGQSQSTVPPIRRVFPFSRALFESCDRTGECVIQESSSTVVTIPAAMGKTDASITYSFGYVTSPEGAFRLSMQPPLCEHEGGRLAPTDFFLAPSTTPTATSVTWVVTGIGAGDQSCVFGSPRLRLLDEHHPGHAKTLGGALILEVSQHLAPQ